MTLKQLAAKAFDEGQRIRLTAVPLIEKEIKGNMAPKKKAFKTVLEQKYEDLKSVNVSLSQANKELQKALLCKSAEHLSRMLKAKRELEVRIEGMVAEVKGARATVEILKREETVWVKKIADLSDALIQARQRVEILSSGNASFERTLTRVQDERDTLSRLLKIIKATANGITLGGEDSVSGIREGLNG